MAPDKAEFHRLADGRERLPVRGVDASRDEAADHAVDPSTGHQSVFEGWKVWVLLLPLHKGSAMAQVGGGELGLG